MSKRLFREGDRVVIRTADNEIRQGVRYNGMTGTVQSDQTDDINSVEIMPDEPRKFDYTSYSGYTEYGFYWNADEVFLVGGTTPTLKDLEDVVSGLREQGMTVDVTVTQMVTTTL